MEIIEVLDLWERNDRKDRLTGRMIIIGFIGMFVLMPILIASKGPETHSSWGNGSWGHKDNSTNHETNK